jgi:hypothetical protein
MNPAWTWTARRLGISAFVVLHMSATLVWAMPACPIRARFLDASSRYLFPLGLWQYWGMFAPDPLRETVTLEAVAADAQGLRYGFAFPTVAGDSLWRATPRFRHPKFVLHVAAPEGDTLRRIAARYVVRQLQLPASAFPVEVYLYHQIRPAPPPGQSADPMTPSQPHLLGRCPFASLDEVQS